MEVVVGHVRAHEIDDVADDADVASDVAARGDDAVDGSGGGEWWALGLEGERVASQSA